MGVWLNEKQTFLLNILMSQNAEDIRVRRVKKKVRKREGVKTMNLE